MPRKSATASGGSLKFQAILAFFQTSSMEIAEFALDLCVGAVKERRARGAKVVAGRAKSANEAVDAATASAASGGAPKAAQTPDKTRKKPGPAKGYKKAKADKPAASAGATSGQGQLTDTPAEVTDAAALPPQEGTLQLD